MNNTHEEYLNELDQDIAGGLDKALATPAETEEEGNLPKNEKKSGREILLAKTRKLIIALLEEGKVDPQMTMAELPAYLEDQMRKQEEEETD